MTGVEVMDTFTKAGEAMLLAEQGNRELSHTIAAAFHGWVKSIKAWLAEMPTSLPPTEPRRDSDQLPIIG